MRPSREARAEAALEGAVVPVQVAALPTLAVSVGGGVEVKCIPELFCNRGRLRHWTHRHGPVYQIAEPPASNLSELSWAASPQRLSLPDAG